MKNEQVCEVCGAVASGIHYTCWTCEGCKSFFRRSIQKKISRFYICYKKHHCVINQFTRSKCKACRFKKCLRIGMAPDLVVCDGQRYMKQRLLHKHRHRWLLRRWASRTKFSNRSLRSAGHRLATLYKECFETPLDLEHFRQFDAWTKVGFQVNGSVSSSQPLVQSFVVHLMRCSTFLDRLLEICQITAEDKRQVLRNCGFETWLLRICQRLRRQCQCPLERSKVVQEAYGLSHRLGSMFQVMNTLINVVFDHSTDRFLMALFISHLMTQTHERQGLSEDLQAALDSLRLDLEEVLTEWRRCTWESPNDPVKHVLIANLTYVRYSALCLAQERFLLELNVTCPKIAELLKFLTVL